MCNKNLNKNDNFHKNRALKKSDGLMNIDIYRVSAQKILQNIIISKQNCDQNRLTDFLVIIIELNHLTAKGYILK